MKFAGATIIIRFYLAIQFVINSLNDQFVALELFAVTRDLSDEIDSRLLQPAPVWHESLNYIRLSIDCFSPIRVKR